MTVRFRFGGSNCPPDIYYKIFTNSPLCDVGAFAPRNYTIYKQLDSRQLNNHCLENNNNSSSSSCAMNASLSYSNISHSSGIQVGSSSFSTQLSEQSESDMQDNGDSGWYQRRENNGWRRVAAKTLSEVTEDPVAKRTKELSVRFHYSKVTRRDELDAKRKARKKQWLLKLYSEEKQQDNSRYEHEEKEQMIENTKTRSPESKSDGDEYDDVDEDELLQWSNQLDFDQYVKDWADVGTAKDLHRG